VTLCGLAPPGTLPDFADAEGRALTVLPDLPTAFARHPEGRVLAVLADPAWDITRHLRDGHSPSNALNAWESRTREILPDLRRHRRRIAIVTDTMLALAPDTVAGLLSEVFGWTPGRVPPAAEDPASAVPAVLHLVAHFALQADPRARDLANEIRAMLPAGAPDEAPDLEIADRAFAEMEAQGTVLDTLSDREERLRATLDLRQAELAAAERRRDQLAEIGRDRESVLGALLLERGGALDDCRGRAQLLEAEKAAQESEIARLRDKIARLHASTSWRVTAPLRAVGRALRSR
jgi:hypothetical protein